MKKIIYFTEFILIKFLFIIFKIIGFKFASNLGFYIGKNFGNLFRKKKSIIENLHKSKISIKVADNESERLSATISLGMIGDYSAVPFLKSLLEDEEANIRWDAAIALAKMGDNSGAYIIEGLLDRAYLSKFNEIDPVEQNRVLMVAIKTASILFDKRFEDNLISLSKNDKDLSIRDAAIKALEKNYSNGTNKL